MIVTGQWEWHASLWLVPAAVFAAVSVWRMPVWVRRGVWPGVVAASAAVAVVWSFLLAASDGLSRVTAPLASRFEYVPFVPRVHDPALFVRTFSARAERYPIHVKGHPPGATLVFWSLWRAGLRGPGWAAALVLLCVGLTAAAVLVACREAVDEAFARRAAPFVALAPAAVWAGTSPDPLYAAAIAIGTAFVISATSRSGPLTDALAVAGGVALAIALQLTYGAVPLLAIPVAVAVARRRWKTLVLVALGAAVVFAVFVGAGFWWGNGLAATRRFYSVGIGGRRSYRWFTFVANPLALVLAIGLAPLVGMARLRDRRAWLLVGAAVAAVVVADVSGLSKGEVERIWLPFTPWLLVAAGALGRDRRWLAAQAGLALAVQATLRSPW